MTIIALRAETDSVALVRRLPGTPSVVKMRLIVLAAVGVVAAAGLGASARQQAQTHPLVSVGARAADADWPFFGLNPQRTDATNRPTGITQENIGRLRRRVVRLPGTVDSSPIYLHDVVVAGATRDVFIVTTTYGRTIAIDAASGRLLWVFTPSTYHSYAGSYQITTSAPAADSDRAHVFAASPDGRIHRLALSNGREEHAGNWPVAITKLPQREKLTGALNVIGNHVIAATGGYVGDEPPYQGHVVVLDRESGQIVGVFNTLCSNRHQIIDPCSCRAVHGSVWARDGVLVEPNGRLLFASGRGHADERTDFGNSVLELTPDASRLLQHWTPRDANTRDAQDVDVGSTGPVPTGRGTIVQSGKDGKLHVLLAPRLGQEVQTLPAPGDGAMIAGYPALWQHAGQTTLFAATDAGTAAYAVTTSGRLRPLWQNTTAGTSPILAGGLLYVYDPSGTLIVYLPTVGTVLARLAAGPGHWNAPVISGGRIALPTGNANDHQTTGTLNLYTPR